ncbi:DUF943 family protein [Serratia sp. M24T3]|uniref:DUF943 family protein n=1 Tax=Serratia sp. M24T3 TaxID=932213 RepID=UPI00025B9F84|nr:DUF943 family protein [Serratia sp. M24T3]EIC83741.1 hypothetical protein SPM24T3_15071 [Serratia sp. M24T3]
MSKIKKLLLIFVIAVTFLIWSMTRPVEIIAVHDGDTLLVKNFPLFKYQKISWWENNKKNIHEKYKIPSLYNDGSYMVFILNYGEGYRVDRNTDQDSDLLCFEDMKVAANCIEKDPLFMVHRASASRVYYH